ncbi:MAG: L-seryl-tRNA(Sec) selenium transferase [Actinobacteria bacterium]|nr:L-seryl-tRNA(Sec) selenium transferase [Actinomycetota bacterium]MDA2994549.1 L-seryl-tRNA(Sec) selenium transferase [Actinomycetota bacterium]
MSNNETAQRPPSVDALARALSAEVDLPHAVLVDCVRRAISIQPDDAAKVARQLCEQLHASLISEVINATGVLLHTNLGRAPITGTSGQRATSVEFDLQDGSRGSRHTAIASLLRMLTGAEDALVVNNNAAAVLLVLSALAENRGVAVSRGESVEIGGGFRVPDVMRRSGARLIDVGTTNKTRREDYEEACSTPDHDIAMLLKVHPSNFSVEGFVESASLRELASLPPVLAVDLGSGLLDSQAPWLPSEMRPFPTWVTDEPSVKQSIEDGADIVMFSGDKLLGGPQCGIIAGRSDLIEECAKHPLMRALRPGHHAIVPLQQVLLAYLDRTVTEDIPFWAMVGVRDDALAGRAQRIIAEAGIGEARVSSAVVGAGAAPGATLPSHAVVVSGDHVEQLRRAKPFPVITRVADGATWIDLRSVHETDDANIIDALLALKR